MKVGTVVKLLVPCLGNPSEAVGVCYEEYHIGSDKGSSFIFANGSYDGFSEDEQESFLREIGYDYNVGSYIFTNVMRVSDDFRNGFWDSVFKEGIYAVL